MRRFVVALAALTLAGPSAPAEAADTDRVRILAGLEVAVTTLPEYVRIGFDGDSGGWRGPVCQAFGPPALSRALTIAWGAGQSRVATAEEAMNRVRTFDYAVVERGTVQLSHVVGGRSVGAVQAPFVVTDSGGDLGYHESALAVRLARGRFVAARFWSAGNAVPCEVGAEAVRTFHRRAARAAVQQVEIVGSLPPARVLSRRAGRRVSGSVRDVYGHPVAGVAVALERRVGRRWRRATSARSGSTGRYVLRARRPGLYRTVATLERFSARSATLRVR